MSGVFIISYGWEISNDSYSFGPAVGQELDIFLSDHFGLVGKVGWVK
jgi:hypothetical protein